MTIRYAVTFEFLMKPPLTHRGTIAASSLGTIASRALREAQKALRPVNWSSCVFVALERVSEAGTGERVTEDGAEGTTGEEEPALAGAGASSSWGGYAIPGGRQVGGAAPGRQGGS